MTVDMKWRDAMAVRCIASAFSQEGKGMGWPEAMEPVQLAAMQRPYELDDSLGKRSAGALRDALLEACEGRAVACESETRNVMVSAARDVTPSRFTRASDWPDAYTRDGVPYAYTRPAVYEERTSYRVAAADFAAWLAAQNMKPSSHIAAWFKVRGVAAGGPKAGTQAAPAIESALSKGYAWPLSMDEVQWDAGPLEGWLPNAPNGQLRHDPGDECRLVRLVDVAAWMADEYPRDEVIRRLIGPLYLNEADPWGWHLFVLNGNGYAKRLIRHFGPSPETVDFWQYLREPDSIEEYGEGVTSGYSAQDVIGVILRMWEYAWPGVGADPNADRDWYMRRVKAANDNRNARVKANSYADTPASADMLSEERQAMMRVLERLAVPIPIAFTLWGWGHAAALPDAVAGAQAAPAVEAQDVTDWPSLVRYRQQFASVVVQKRPAWLPAHVELLASQLQQECAVGQGRGALGRLGKALGTTRQALAPLMQKHQYSPTTGQKDAGWAAQLSGAGDRKQA